MTKKWNAVNLKIKFEQKGAKIKCLIEKLNFFYSLPLSPTKSDDWNVLLLICNHFPEQNFFDKLIKKYFYKQNKTLSSIYLFRSTTGSLKNRTALLSLGDFICKVY